MRTRKSPEKQRLHLKGGGENGKTLQKINLVRISM